MTSFGWEMSRNYTILILHLHKAHDGKSLKIYKTVFVPYIMIFYRQINSILSKQTALDCALYVYSLSSLTWFLMNNPIKIAI